MSLAGIGYVFYRKHISKLEKEAAKQRAFSKQLIDSQGGERKRIAAELHDGLSQSLSIIKNRASVCLSDPADQEQVVEHLEEIKASAAIAIEEAKEIAYNLRPYQLDRLGLTRTIRVMLDKVSNSAGIQIFADIDSIDGLFRPEEEIGIYRIIQESINNIVKHAEAAEVRVSIKKNEGHVLIIIQDDGKGLSAGAVNSGGRVEGGFGLLGIAERVRMLDGRHEIHSSPGKGTSLIVRLELKDKNHGS